MKHRSRCKTCGDTGVVMSWIKGRIRLETCEVCARRRLVIERLVFVAICIAGAILGLLLRGVP